MFNKLKKMVNKENNEEYKEIDVENETVKLGYLNLSGCNGDLLSLTEDYDNLVKIINKSNIVYGTPIISTEEVPNMDIAFVEGSVCLEDDYSINELKKVRKKSKILIALGSCATNGGFTRFTKGGQKPQTKHESFVPLSQIIKVDLAIPGCPVSPEMMTNIITAIYNHDKEYLKVLQKFVAKTDTSGLIIQEEIMNATLCIGCGMCAIACPTKSMTMINGRPNFNYNRCVKCGSCYFHCPRSWWPKEQIRKDTEL